MWLKVSKWNRALKAACASLLRACLSSWMRRFIRLVRTLPSATQLATISKLVSSSQRHASMSIERQRWFVRSTKLSMKIELRAPSPENSNLRAYPRVGADLVHVHAVEATEVFQRRKRSRPRCVTVVHRQALALPPMSTHLRSVKTKIRSLNSFSRGPRTSTPGLIQVIVILRYRCMAVAEKKMRALHSQQRQPQHLSPSLQCHLKSVLVYHTREVAPLREVEVSHQTITTFPTTFKSTVVIVTITSAADLVQIQRRPKLSMPVTNQRKIERVAMVFLEQAKCAKSNKFTNKTQTPLHHLNKQKHRAARKSISSGTSLLNNSSKGSLNSHLEEVRVHKNHKERHNLSRSLSMQRKSLGRRMHWSRWWMWSLAILTFLR